MARRASAPAAEVYYHKDAVVAGRAGTGDGGVVMNRGDPEYDAAFREVFRTILLAPPEVCARCARTFATHIRDAYLDGIDHDFEALNVN